MYNNFIDVYLRDGVTKKLDLSKQYIIEVRGWIMCKNIEPGYYRVKLSNHTNGRIVASLYKRKGTKLIVRHFLDDLGLMSIDCTDLNGTIILYEYDGKL